MLWKRASASSKTRARRSAETPSVTARSRVDLGPLHGPERPELLRPAQLLHGLGFEPGLVEQAVLDEGVVVGAVEGLLEPPVAPVPGAGGPLHVLELREGVVDRGVRQERPAPVPFEGEQALGEPFGEAVRDEVAAVLPEDVLDLRVGVPAQPAPDDLVDVVVAPFGVGQEADGVVLVGPEDRGLSGRPGVDDLAGLGQGEGEVPVGDGVLGLPAVGDVGVASDRVARGDGRPQFRQAHPDLRAVHDPAEPLGLAGDDLEELVEPLPVEALRRDPHLRLGVVAAEDLGLLLQQGHEVLRLACAGVAAGDEDGVDARQLPEDLAPLLEGELDGLGVGVVLVHGGIPDPDVQAVVVEELRHPGHHLDLRAGEVGAVGGVVGARGDQLDGVGAEDREVADVLLPLREVPGVVRVRLRPVAELVPPDRHLGRGLDPEPVREEHPPARHPQLAEQPADAEEDASGVVAGDEDHRPFPSRPDPIAFRLLLTAALRERLGMVLPRRT